MAVTHTSDSNSDSQPFNLTLFQDWQNLQRVQEENQEALKRGHQASLAMVNWTQFYPSEAIETGSWGPDKRVTWNKLEKHNRDSEWKNREDQNHSAQYDRRYKQHLVAAIAAELKLSQLQREVAFKWLMKLDIPRMGHTTVSIAFVICAIVLNRDVQRFGGSNVYHPQRKPENNDPAFNKLRDSLRPRHKGFSTKSLTKVYHKLSQGTPPTRPPERWKPYFRHKHLPERDPSAQPSFNPEDHPRLKQR